MIFKLYLGLEFFNINIIALFIVCNKLRLHQKIFINFLGNYTQIRKRKPPFDFQIDQVCHYKVMGLRFL